MYSLGWDSVVISSVNNEKNKLFIGKALKKLPKITEKMRLTLLI